jgi:hypothetical protein
MTTPQETTLVTGSSGLIGSAVINRLANGFDQAGPPHPPPAAECLRRRLLSGFTAGAQWNDVMVGAGLILSLPRGIVPEHYGSWDPYVI